MKKIIISILGIFALNSGVAIADESKITKGYHTMDAMGCMLLRECTDGVEKVFSLLDISSQYPNTDSFYPIATEFNNMLVSLNRVGVNVFLAEEKYFPVGHRGVYHTVGNNFFLNKSFMHRPGVLMSVMRHEGWHAAQDCMAGEITNNFMAVIWDDGYIPEDYILRANIRYAHQPNVIPWEAEAIWAGDTPYATANALKACNNPEGNMWDVYPPTPMTGEWLINNGYWDGVTK